MTASVAVGARSIPMPSEIVATDLRTEMMRCAMAVRFRVLTWGVLLQGVILVNSPQVENRMPDAVYVT